LGNWLRGSDVKAKAMRGSLALSIGAISQRVIRLGRIMVLTRLLVPEDFGVIAITTMVVVMMETLTDAGVRVYLIQSKEGNNPSYLNGAWWFQAIRGIGLFSVSFLVAPFFSFYYQNPTLTDLLRVSFISIIFNGLVSPHVHILEREFKFGKWTMLEQLSAVIGTFITVVLAYYIRSVWAIVFGTVVERFIYCLFSHILYPFSPKLEIDRKSLSDLFKFSKGILGLSVLNLISRQADIFILGKIVTPAILGCYFLAMQLTDQVSSVFSSVINPVLLPSFAKMKENKPILKESLLSVNNSIATIFIPITVFMAANSNEIISLFYGSQYKTGGLALSILSITVFVRVQTSVLSQAYFGLGLPHLIRQQSLKRTVLIAVLMYPAARFAGLSGAAAVMLLASVAMFIFQLYNLGGILYFRPIDYLSTWHMGVGFGVLVFIPSVFIFVSEIDSLIFKSVLSAGVMVIVIIIGCIKMFKTTVQ